MSNEELKKEMKETETMSKLLGIVKNLNSLPAYVPIIIEFIKLIVKLVKALDDDD